MTKRQFVLISALALARGAFAGDLPQPAAARIRRSPVSSSSLASVGYDAVAKVLEIEFRRGAVYRYLAVPEAIFRKFMSAESKGRYFSQHIRGRYDFQRISETKP